MADRNDKNGSHPMEVVVTVLQSQKLEPSSGTIVRPVSVAQKLVVTPLKSIVLGRV
jgi:hypothetical protein